MTPKLSQQERYESANAIQVDNTQRKEHERYMADGRSIAVSLTTPTQPCLPSD